jgi:hypothetical protein
MGHYVIDEENTKLILNHDVGFYSNCTINLRSIIWECVKIKKFYSIDTSRQWSRYKDYDGDVYSKFFKVTDDNFEIVDFDFTNDKEEEQFSDYRLINFDFVTPFVKKYFSLSDEVIEIENQLIDKYNINFHNTIAVLYRGNDKCKETNIPTYEDMDIKLHDVVKTYPNYKILIQSDEIEFCDFMIKYNNSFIIKEIEKINKTKDNPIQHFIPVGSKVRNAQTFLAIMSIISKCNIVILNSGNVGMWTCLLRGHVKNVHQYLNPKKHNNFYWINE